MGDFFLAANVSSLGNGHMPLFLPLGRKKYALCGVHARVQPHPRWGRRADAKRVWRFVKYLINQAVVPEKQRHASHNCR